jgi:hypothetical protein
MYNQIPYIVKLSTYDATRPYMVVAMFRSFNRVAGRYETKEQATRRMRDLTRQYHQNCFD